MSRGTTIIKAVFRRDRLTGQLAIGVVAALCVTAVVFGTGMASARYHISDVGAWLGAGKKGMVVHANGLAGKVDGKATVPGSMAGHNITVQQDGNTVLIVDKDTGVVARVDPTTFDVGAGRKLGDAAGLQLVTGSNQAYALDQVKGTVQRIDPMTLGAVGQAVQLTAPLGASAIDARGTLWVPQGNTGQVVPVQSGKATAPVTVGKSGDTLALTVAAGVPVVTDSTQASATVVATTGPLMTVNLPSSVKQQKNGLLAPVTSEGQIVPLLATDQKALVLLNAGNGSLSAATVRLPAHRFGAPQNLGTRVYIPDTTAGALLVYDTATGRLQQPVQVPGAQGKVLEVFVRSGLLWANNPDGPNAVVINTTGTPTTVGKYDTKVPGGGNHTIPKNNGGRGAGTGRGRGNGGNSAKTEAPQIPVPQPTTTKQPWQAPDAPVIGTATPGNGVITVTFGPGSTGGKATDYVLVGSGTATPASIPATGPAATSFQVSALDCAQEYSFKVAVRYTDEQGKQQQKTSDPTSPVRPCVTPAVPSLTAGNIRNHGLTLTWSSTKPTGTTLTLTGTTGLGSGVTVSAAAGSKALTVPNSLTATYSYKLTAASAAGTTSATATAKVDPKAHTPISIKNTHNGSTSTWVRPAPAANGSAHVATIPVNVYVKIPVYCQVRGKAYTDPYNSSLKTDLWNYVKYNGAWGYLPDMYMATSNTNTTKFSPEITWQCT